MMKTPECAFTTSSISDCLVHFLCHLTLLYQFDLGCISVTDIADMMSCIRLVAILVYG